MILALLSPQSLLQNCLPPAANQKLGRCRRAVLVAREVFTRPPRDESFTLNTRLGLVSITQRAPQSYKSKITLDNTAASPSSPCGNTPQGPPSRLSLRCSILCRAAMAAK